MKLLAANGLCACLLLLTGCGSDDGGGLPAGIGQDVEKLLGGLGAGGGTGGNMSGDDVFAPLRPLLGTVNFQYEFPSNPDVTTFSDTVVFSTENFLVTESGVAALAALDIDGGTTVCVSIELAGFPYLCISADTITTPEGSLDYFLFSELTNGFASGLYEFCASDGTECDTPELTALQLIESPDGTVNVTVTPASASLAGTGEGSVNARFKHANENEFKLYHASIAPEAVSGRMSESIFSAEVDDAMVAIHDVLQKIEENVRNP